MLTSTSKSSTSDIEPSLFCYNNNVSEVEIHMSNCTTRTELVYLNAFIFEVQPVLVDEFKTNARIITDTVSSTIIFSEELRKAYVLNFYVFSTGDADVRHASWSCQMIMLLQSDTGICQQLWLIRSECISIYCWKYLKIKSPWASNVILEYFEILRWFSATKQKDNEGGIRFSENRGNIRCNGRGSILFCKRYVSQVEISGPHKERKASKGHLGLYEFNRMPFELKGALATLKRLMQYI